MPRRLQALVSRFRASQHESMQALGPATARSRDFNNATLTSWSTTTLAAFSDPPSKHSSGVDKRFEQQSHATLQSLSEELLLTITSHLDIVDTVCLSLTSRGLDLSDLRRSFSSRLDAATKEELLLRIERDSPALSYCHVRRRLLPFAQTHLERRLLHFHDCEASPQHEIVLPYSECYRLPLCTARLAINHAVLGPQHGIPASALSHAHAISHPDDYQLRRYESWTCKVARGGGPSPEQLMLRCVRSWVSIRESHHVALLRRHFHDNKIAMCRHCEVDLALDENGCRRVIIGTESFLTTGSCARCETDWEIRIGLGVSGEDVGRPVAHRWLDGYFSWTVIVKTCHRLGRCQDPSDPMWRAMLSDDAPVSARAFGLIKTQWNDQ
ncbi:uncharacterized protein B0I36DRAFT_365201 [Microdochium trichocladiopsis]|uniref:F-box domain-containing protein n=1 Tax=Microdochium trichocladiopsis TaxID=1682393 RepID=A0A9P8Y5R4_9PEZI|nr:uncharacterized protein B0I36DRAFT_365201 [Microdochium trichocladiopsis]KAH7028086.1 hypothetical protein B0I36DRAFT_365201 [Microdochium trichocladiopsis]